MGNTSSRRKRFCATAFLLGGIPGLCLVSSTHATILFEDTFYWRPGGITVIDPPVPPTDAYVKIQETVYDDAQGRDVLTQQLNLGLIHGNGGALPAFRAPVEVYGYSITNLNYGNGPTTNAGAGVTGFHIPNQIGGGAIMYAPTAANDNWAEDTNPPTEFAWDIDNNANRKLGDGVGILLGQTHNSFYLVVPAGTPHGFVPNTSVHTWTGGGALEQPFRGNGAMDVDYIFGIVSGPVPEPALFSAAALALVTLGTRRRAN